jgi:hypothetical protein
LSGVEMLQLQGFHASHLRRPIHATDGLLGNLAGNAFSAFSFGPVFGTVVPMLGLQVHDFPLGITHTIMEEMHSDGDDVDALDDDVDEAGDNDRAASISDDERTESW